MSLNRPTIATNRRSKTAKRRYKTMDAICDEMRRRWWFYREVARLLKKQATQPEEAGSGCSVSFRKRFP